MKILLRKLARGHSLSFEELNTILTEAEANLNSRLLLDTDCRSPDSVPSLSPGHFLIGRPLLSPPILQVSHTSRPVI